MKQNIVYCDKCAETIRDDNYHTMSFDGLRGQTRVVHRELCPGCAVDIVELCSKLQPEIKA